VCATRKGCNALAHLLQRVYDTVTLGLLCSGCEEGLAMRNRLRPLLESEAACTVGVIIGLGMLPIVLAITALFINP